MSGVLALIALAGCEQAPAPEEQRAALTGFDWLVGCWQSREGLVERWEAPLGGVMTGESLVPDGDGAQVQQILQIAARADGAVAYSAAIGDRPPLEFVLADRGDAEAVFESSSGPPPRRVSYSRNDSVLALTVFETLNENARGWTTNYTRCSGDFTAP